MSPRGAPPLPPFCTFHRIERIRAGPGVVAEEVEGLVVAVGSVLGLELIVEAHGAVHRTRVPVVAPGPGPKVSPVAPRRGVAVAVAVAGRGGGGNIGTEEDPKVTSAGSVALRGGSSWELKGSRDLSEGPSR